MRLGYFGGTFDPPHLGHLLAASDAAEQLSLDQLVFIPAFAQPLKGEPSATSAQRLEMVRRTVANDARFAVDPIEVERNRLSFTVETLEALAERNPSAERFLLVGADVLTSFARWREPSRVRALAEMVVLQRGEGGVVIAADQEAAGRLLRESAGASASSNDEALRPPRVLSTRCIEVSSTEIRARARAGKSIHGFVTESVADYIADHGLYR